MAAAEQGDDAARLPESEQERFTTGARLAANGPRRLGQKVDLGTAAVSVQAEKALSQWRENDKLAGAKRSRRVRDPFRRS